jgi:hypothetical protein
MRTGDHEVSAQFKLSSVAVGTEGDECDVIARATSGEGSKAACKLIAKMDGKKFVEQICDCFGAIAPATEPLQ